MLLLLFSYQNDVRISFHILSGIFSSLRSHCVWLHDVYLTSRMEGLDSMMATMILSM